MASTAASNMPSHGPYAPQTAGLGGSPTKTLDDPITSIFLVLFILGAATHMTLLQINRRRGIKFLKNGMLFGFCMARIVTCTMRLVWSTHVTNISIAIAAQIFVSAGVVLLFIINLILTQRILRASFPGWAWSKWISVAFKAYYASIVLVLVMLITCIVQSFYTLNTNTHRIDHDVQLTGATYYAVASFLPLPLLALCAFAKKERTERFGTGKREVKMALVAFTAVILCLGAAFRAGTAYLPRPREDPAWYHSKACFYLFNFTIEIIVVYLYAAVRIDKLFHIPNGSHKAGDYSGAKEARESWRSDVTLMREKAPAERDLEAATDSA